MQKVIDISGQKFGRLTAIKPAGKGSKGETLWACDCECGGKSVVRGTRLRSGETVTCGGKGRSCKRRELADISGRRFGKLEVLRLAGERVYGKQRVGLWECRCDCGNVTTLARTAFSAGQESCGCVGREATRVRSTTHGKSGTPEYRLLHGAKRRAKKRGIPFDINLSDIVIPKKCPLLGLALKKAERRIRPNSPTLDRKTPSIGYTVGNVWVISNKANQMKSDATLETLKHFVRVLENEITV